MSRRARTRRDKRAPQPDFDDPQPRMPGLFHFWSHDRLLQRGFAMPKQKQLDEARASRRTRAVLADVIRRPGSRAVLALHLPELGIRSRRHREEG